MNLPSASLSAIFLCLFQGPASESTVKKSPPKAPSKEAPQAAAGTPGTSSQKKDKPKPLVKKTDHDSVDTLVDALYEVISGPKGQKRDWKRFFALFHERAELNALVMGRDGKRRFFRMSPQEYSQRSGKWGERNGFFEKETFRRQELYGHIAQVFSTYELRVGRETKKPDLIGINSIQCSQVGGKWRILSLLWEDRRSAGPIPERYTGKARQELPDEDSAELIRAMEEWEIGERAMQDWDMGKPAEKTDKPAGKTGKPTKEMSGENAGKKGGNDRK